MRNKLFELYRPKQLTEFLEFIKESPKEKFVYVLQHPPQNINILAISTSEIKISVIIKEEDTLKAVKKLHNIFDLD